MRYLGQTQEIDDDGANETLRAFLRRVNERCDMWFRHCTFEAACALLIGLHASKWTHFGHHGPGTLLGDFREWLVSRTGAEQKNFGFEAYVLIAMGLPPKRDQPTPDRDREAFDMLFSLLDEFLSASPVQYGPFEGLAKY